MSQANEPAIGDALPIKSLRITRALIDAYGELADDFNPIHFDDEVARQRGFPAAIGHGAIAASLVFAMLTDWLADWPIESDDLDLVFVGPVIVGDLVIAGGEIEAEEDDAWRCKVWCRNEHDKLVIAGTALVRRERTQA